MIIDQLIFGFKFLRIWSTNFWRNKIHETEKLISLIKTLELDLDDRNKEIFSESFLD